MNIADWYASPDGTSIRMYNAEKAPHFSPRFSTDKLVMQEVAYHISTGLSIGLHRKKKAPWPILPFWIRSHTIRSLKKADVEVEEFKKFHFGTNNFNPYNPHGLYRDHCARVYYSWIREVCHWLEKDPWRYCYKSSRLNEPVNMVVEWIAALKAAVPKGVAATTTTSRKHVQDKGKRKIVESAKVEKSYKFKEDPLVEKLALEIEAKR